MKTSDGKDLDFTGKKFGITMDGPLTVSIDPDTGSLLIEAPQLHMLGATFQVHLTPAAAQQLATGLKHFESVLGTPIEDLAKPDSVQ